MAPLAENRHCNATRDTQRRRDAEFCVSLRKGLVLLLLLFSPLFAQTPPAPDPAQKDLARVAILKYEDLTETARFGYMPTSLAEAIDASLQKKFEYVREDPAATEAAYRAAQKDASTKAPQAQSDSHTAQAAVDFQRQRHIDILILGHFTYDSTKGEIVVATFISTGKKSEFQALALRNNKVNATIFNLADKVADDIVAELARLAKEQHEEKARVNAAATTNKPSQKMELLKTLKAQNFWLSLAGGYAQPVADAHRYFDNMFTGKLAASYRFARFFTPYLSGGIIRYGLKVGVSTGSTPTVNNGIFYFANAGFAFPIELSPTVEIRPYIAGGMLGGNPTSNVRTLDWLVPLLDGGFYFAWYFMPNVGLALSGSALVVLDQPKPLFFVNGAVGVAVRF